MLISGDLPAPVANAKSLAFGDWRTAYAVRRVNGSPCSGKTSSRQTQGKSDFRAAARVDGRPLLSDAARILAHSAT